MDAGFLIMLRKNLKGGSSMSFKNPNRLKKKKNIDKTVIMHKGKVITKTVKETKSKEKS